MEVKTMAGWLGPSLAASAGEVAPPVATRPLPPTMYGVVEPMTAEDLMKYVPQANTGFRLGIEARATEEKPAGDIVDDLLEAAERVASGRARTVFIAGGMIGLALGIAANMTDDPRLRAYSEVVDQACDGFDAVLKGKVPEAVLATAGIVAQLDAAMHPERTTTPDKVLGDVGDVLGARDTLVPALKHAVAEIA